MSQLKNYTTANLSELQADLEDAEAKMREASNIFYDARRELVRLQNIRNDLWWQKLRSTPIKKDTPY